MSNLSLCDLNNHGSLLKVHDMSPNTKCKGQKQLTFTPNQFQLEGAWFKNTKKKIKGTERMWNNFIRPALKIASRIISTTVAAWTKSPQLPEITSAILKSLTGSKIFSLTDFHSQGLRLRVM